MKSMNIGSRGFTLIEIMIVLLILGLLAAVATPAFLNASARAKTNVCISHLKHIDDAKSMWAVWEGAISGDIPEWDDLVPDYLTEVPACPSNGTYDIKPIDVKPTCSIEGHVLQGS